MNCEECKKKCGDMATVSKPVYVLSVEKQKAKKNFWKAIAIIAILLCFVSNLLWLMYRTSLEKVVETTETYTFEGIEQNAEGSNYIVGGDMNGNAEN